MGNSDDLSAARTAGAPRRQVHLSGPSVALDPGRYAVRRDLAELAVADRVFAQHYAEPMAVAARSAVVIHAQPDSASAAIGTLAKGEWFHLLDIGQSWAWGRCDTAGSVGYVEAGALDLP